MDALAEASPAGANGLIYLPYLSGERCPIWDPEARGVFFGLSFATAYGDAVRAIMEGVAFSIRQGQEIALAHMPRPDHLSLGGGIGNSRIWCQIFADVLNYPIARLRISETETLGSAILAAHGVGLLDDMGAMAAAAAEGCETLKPRPALAAFYDDAFALYERLYRDLKGDFSLLQELKRAPRLKVRRKPCQSSPSNTASSAPTGCGVRQVTSRIACATWFSTPSSMAKIAMRTGMPLSV